MLNPLVQENVMLYCPLWWQPLLCSLSLLFFTITSLDNAQFSLTLNDLTLLEAIFIALLHRWQLTWRIYDNITSMWIWTNINHYVVFLVQCQQFWHIIFWWGITITTDFQDSVFACESSLPLLILSWVASLTNAMFVNLQ